MINFFFKFYMFQILKLTQYSPIYSYFLKFIFAVLTIKFILSYIISRLRLSIYSSEFSPVTLNSFNIIQSVWNFSTFFRFANFISISSSFTNMFRRFRFFLIFKLIQNSFKNFSPVIHSIFSCVSNLSIFSSYF